MADETLLYTGEFDGSRIKAGIQDTTGAFTEMESVAENAFAEITAATQKAEEAAAHHADVVKQSSATTARAVSSSKESTESAYAGVDAAIKRSDSVVEEHTRTVQMSAQTQERILQEQAEYRRHWEVESLNNRLRFAEKKEGIDREAAVQSLREEMRRLSITEDMLDRRAQMILSSTAELSAEESKAQQDKMRIQARHEEEFLTARYQADLAEAQLVANGWDAKIAVAKVKMEKDLQDLAGNLHAQEEARRKHNAIIKGLEYQKAQAGDVPMRLITARGASLITQMNTIAMATGLVAPEFGRVAAAAAFASARIQSMEQALDAGGFSLRRIIPIAGAAAAGLAVVGAAVYLMIKQRKELDALRGNLDWLVDADTLRTITRELNIYVEAEKAAGDAIAKKNAIMGTGSVYVLAYSRNLKTAADASAALRRETGLTEEEILRLESRFGGAAEAAAAATQIRNKRLLDAGAELNRARLEGLEDGLKKQLALEDDRYDAAVRADQDYYNGVIFRSEQVLNNKKSTEEQKKKAEQDSAHAQQEMGKVLERRAQEHETRVTRIHKDAMKERSEARLKMLSEANRLNREAAAEAAEAAKEQADALRESEIEYQEYALAEQNKLMRALADNRGESLRIQQASEAEAAEARVQYAKSETERVMALDAQKAMVHRHQVEREREILALQGALIQQSLSLAGALAGVFNNTRIQRYVGYLQQAVTILTTIRALYATIAALNALSGGAAGAVGGGGAAKVAALVLGAGDAPVAKAAGGVVYGKDRLVRMNESGQEGIVTPVGLQKLGGERGLAKLNSGVPDESVEAVTSPDAPAIRPVATERPVEPPLGLRPVYPLPTMPDGWDMEHRPVVRQSAIQPIRPEAPPSRPGRESVSVQSSMTVGDIYVTVPSGDPRAVSRAVRSAVAEAVIEREKERTRNYYDDGTIGSRR